jgi:hypothetical protein
LFPTLQKTNREVIPPFIVCNSRRLNSSSVRYELNDEAISLLTLSLSALVSASAVYPSVIKTDLHACIMHIFATILATPSCQTTVVPQALPIFKRFLTSITTTPQPETGTQLRSALARFLTILKKAQQREFDQATQCEKNALLACTILLSSAGSVFAADDPLLERFTTELSECLESRFPSKVAANCARSLLIMPKRHAAEESLAALLLPQLLGFLSKPSDVEGIEESFTIVGQTLTAWIQTLAGTPHKTSVAMALVTPTLLSRASSAGPTTYKETASRLSELAAVDQTRFRTCMGTLDGEQKAFMEQVIREGGVKREVVRREESGEPSIALKMDF